MPDDEREVLMLPPNPQRKCVYISFDSNFHGAAVRCLKCGAVLFQRMRIELHDAIELLNAVLAHGCFAVVPPEKKERTN